MGILVGVLVVVSASLVGYLTYRQSATAMVDTALEEVHAITKATSGRFAAGLESLQQDTGFLAATAAVQALTAQLELPTEERDPETYRRLQQRFGDLAALQLDGRQNYLRIGLLDSERGTWLASREVEGAPAEIPSFGLDLNSATRLSPVQADGQRQVVSAAAPVAGVGSPLLVVVQKDLGPLVESLGENIPRGRQLLLIEPQGHFLAHTDAEVSLAGTVGAPTVAEVYPMMGEALLRDAQVNGTLVRHDAYGRRVAASLLRIRLDPGVADGFYAVGVIADYDEVVAAARVVRDQTLIFTLVLVALAILLGWRLAEGIAGPLDEIAASVESYGQGSPDFELPVDAPGEAGLVARAFADMAHQVDERTRLLQAEIDARRHTEEALRGSENRFRAFYHDSPAMFLTSDPEGRIISINRFGADRLGFRPEDLIGRPFSMLYPKEEREEAEEYFRTVLLEEEPVYEREARMMCRDGSTPWVRTVNRVMRGEEGRVVLWVGEDTTRAHELSEDLSFREHHDTLTGLPNRREVERRLQILIEHAAEKGSEHALCLLDLDQFKVVNDTCGHPAGDELLRQVARALEAHIDPPDLLARLGGDEFAILLKDCPLHHAVSRVESLRASLKSMNFSWEGQRFEISSSVGLVQLSGTEHSVSTAMSLADTLCFAAKDAGRDRLQVYEEGDSSLEQIQEEMKAVSMITEAFEQDRFRLYRQPIVPVRDDEDGDHYEILIRMLDPEGRILPPGVFLQSAERYNLAGRIDRWVVGNTLGWLKRNREELDRLSLCSINLSGQSLGDPELLQFIDQQFEDGIISPDRICFEVTETVAVANMHAAIEFIQVLKKRGCLFALDDFGSGLSSFAYLRNLPVDLLKIDGMFVRDIATDATAFAMVKSIHEVGQVMGKRTIAEFVENDRILAKLNYIGVDYAQGYGISAPRPIEEPLFDQRVARPPSEGDRSAA